MDSSFSGLKYGKLYTMQEVFDVAESNCRDEVARTNASEWAVIGYNDLEHSRQYMERSSAKYAKTRLMMRTLAQISSRRVLSEEKFCEQIKVVANTSRHYLANIDAVEMIKDDKVVLAAVKYR